MLEDGNKYAFTIVSDDGIDAAIADGWSKTYSEAYAAHQKSEDEKPLTREELEALAKEKGIKFDGRTSDKKLSELVWATVKDNS